MSSVLGVGVIGAGSIGIRGALEHLWLPDVQDRVRLAAICDNVHGRAAAAAAKYGVASAYDTLEDLLEDPAVDVVTLATPIGLHYDQGLAAIRAGKHIHFNKTMTTTAAEATHLIDEAAKAGVKLVASPGQMVRPENQEIRRLVVKGELGKVAWAAAGATFGKYHEEESVRQGNDLLSNINPAWYWRKPGGGPLYDMTVYGLHTLTGILGPAKRVSAMSGVAVHERMFKGEAYKVDADDNTLAILDYGDAAFAFVYGTVAGGLVDFGRANVYGTAGSVVGLNLNGKPLEFPGFDDGLASHQRGPHLNETHRNMEECHVFEDFMQLVDYVRDDTAPYATAEHARHVIEIIEAIYRSAETGQTQALQTTFEPIEV